MKTELTKLEGNVVELKVEFDSEEWKASQNKVLKRVAQNINVPGFRKGKAPVAMIKQAHQYVHAFRRCHGTAVK